MSKDEYSEPSIMASPPTQVGVVALDAADYRLVQNWELEHLLLDEHRSLETFTYTNPEDPHTLDIWPTVATGLDPSEHGVAAQSNTEWKDPKWALLSGLSSYFIPQRLRTVIGNRLLDEGVTRGLTAPVIDAEHMFDAAYMWPGICPAAHFESVQEALHAVRHGTLSESELRSLLYRYTADELGWLAARNGLAGVHCHALDIAGHAFARRENNLREYYAHVDSLVGWLSDVIEELVVLSDHGMQVEWLEDPEPGGHSLEPFIAATDGIESPLPADIRDVHEWLTEFTLADRPPDRTAVVDTPSDQLRDLGYL